MIVYVPKHSTKTCMRNVMIYLILVISVGLFISFSYRVDLIYADDSKFDIIDIKTHLHKGDISKYIGCRVIFEFKKIRKHDRFPNLYYVYINEDSRYNIFLHPVKKIENNKLKKITGVISNVENGVVFVKPDKIDTK